MWADEFDRTALDPTRWLYRTDTRDGSTQLAAIVAVHAGLLWLAWKKKKTAKSGYTAGGVSTRRVFRHGFYEARFKVPPTKGWHPKFWMMHHGRAAAPAHPGSRQEIDVCENDSITPTRDGANLSGWRPAHQGHGYRTVNTPAESADFHGGRRVHAGENHRPLRRPYREYR